MHVLIIINAIIELNKQHVLGSLGKVHYNLQINQVDRRYVVPAKEQKL